MKSNERDKPILEREKRYKERRGWERETEKDRKTNRGESEIERETG